MKLVDNIDIANEFMRKGFESQMNGNLDDARINYKLSIKYNPTAEAYTHLAWIYGRNGSFEEAIEECFNAIELDPEFGNPYNDVGTYLVSLEREEESIEWFQKAVRIKNYTSKHLPLYNLGKIYRRKGYWKKASEMFKHALNINPEYSPARKEYYSLLAISN